MMFKKRSEKGQSLVEVALAMPLLILIVVGILDLGRAYYTYITISDAAAEGASYAAIHPTRTQEIVDRVIDSSNGMVDLTDEEIVQIEVSVAEVGPGNPVTVTVTYEYDILTPIIQRLTADGMLTLKAEVVQSIMQ